MFAKVWAVGLLNSSVPKKMSYGVRVFNSRKDEAGRRCSLHSVVRLGLWDPSHNTPMALLALQARLATARLAGLPPSAGVALPCGHLAVRLNREWQLTICLPCSLPASLLPLAWSGQPSFARARVSVVHIACSAVPACVLVTVLVPVIASD